MVAICYGRSTPHTWAAHLLNSDGVWITRAPSLRLGSGMVDPLFLIGGILVACVGLALAWVLTA